MFEIATQSPTTTLNLGCSGCTKQGRRPTDAIARSVADAFDRKRPTTRRTRGATRTVTTCAAVLVGAAHFVAARDAAVPPRARRASSDAGSTASGRASATSARATRAGRAARTSGAAGTLPITINRNWHAFATTDGVVRTTVGSTDGKVSTEQTPAVGSTPGTGLAPLRARARAAHPCTRSGAAPVVVRRRVVVTAPSEGNDEERNYASRKHIERPIPTLISTFHARVRRQDFEPE